jgi:hypothetical protein
VGDPSESIDVLASDLQVNTIQATVQGVFTFNQIAHLPLNGRNFLDLAQLEPGIQIQDGQNFDPTKGGYSSISFDGRFGRTARIEVTNNYHGEAFGQFRDSAVGALLSTPPGITAPYQRSQYGGALAGPIEKQIVLLRGWREEHTTYERASSCFCPLFSILGHVSIRLADNPIQICLSCCKALAGGMPLQLPRPSAYRPSQNAERLLIRWRWKSGV